MKLQLLKFRSSFVILVMLIINFILIVGEVLVHWRGGYELLSFPLREGFNTKRSVNVKNNLSLRFSLMPHPELTGEDYEFFRYMNGIFSRNKSSIFGLYDFFKEWNSNFVRINKDHFADWPIPRMYRSQYYNR